MISFYLIRHGQKQAVPFDPSLTEVGFKQAEVTVEYLKNISLKEIVCSPKLRTRQTAEIIAKPHSLIQNTNIGLVERLEWEKDKSFDEFIAEWNKTDFDRNYLPKTGNSSVNKGFEMKKVIDELYIKHKDGAVLLVTHGGAIGDLLRNLFGEKATPHKIDPITGAPHILISECSITTIRRDNDKFDLVGINDISHLPTPLI